MKKAILSLIIFFILYAGKTYCQKEIGDELTFKNNEIVLAGYFNLNISRINIQGPFYNLTIIPSDKRNNNKINGSALGAISLTPLLILLPFTHMDSTKNLAHYLGNGFIYASALLNSQVHIKLLNFNGLLFNKVPVLSVFISSRTEYFAFRSNDWWQYSYGLGLEYFLYNHRKEHTIPSEGFGLQMGIERPLELINWKNHPKPLRVFLGFKIMGYN